MDRDQFESALDTLIAAYGHKVRTEIDASACGTRWDWDKYHQADDSYQEAREAFLLEVFARLPLEP